MVNEKIKKYGNPLGVSNYEEVRKKITETYLLKHIQNNITKSENKITCFEGYYNYILRSYSSTSKANHHFRQVFKHLSSLRNDERWTTKLETIFNGLIEMSEEDFENVISNEMKKKRKEGIEKTRGVHKDPKLTNITKMLKTIKENLLRSENITNWKEYCNAVLNRYVGVNHAYKHINKLIDLLPDLKQDKRWTKEYESLFGGLTDEDRVKPRNRRKNYGNDTGCNG